MKKITWLFALSLLAITLHAQGMRFVLKNSWKDVLAQAKKENKLIFLDAFATWCGPCKYMQDEVFTNSQVASFFNKNFINVQMDMEKGEGPQLAEDFGLTAYPTLFFINGDGKVVHKNVGALESEEFIKLGNEALDPEKQYYTIKEKAKSGNVSSAAFHDWIHTAEKLEDSDLDEVTRLYFEKTTNPISQYHMLVMTMDHVEFITENQLRYLYKNRDSIATITKRTPDQVIAAFKKRVVSYATLKSAKGDSIDFHAFKSILLQYPPINAELETRKLKIRHFSENEQTARAMDELAACFTDPRSGLTIEEMFSLVRVNLDPIISSGRADKIIRLTESYPVSAAEKEKSYYKDLALFAIYATMENKEKAGHHGSAVWNNENVSIAIKESVL